MNNVAIVLAGGNGSRMKSNMPKQYMQIEGRTVLFYSLKQFQDCSFIDQIILVTRAEDVEECKKEYTMSKITHVVAGGKERYESVMNGLAQIDTEGYVFIHDGARPCISQESLEKVYEDVKKYKATVLAVKSKDTVRLSDNEGNAVMTPARNNVWLIQTPQVFDTKTLKQAYECLTRIGTDKIITDDAMIIEEFTDIKIHLTEGEYTNIKITTPEDLRAVSDFFKKS